MADDKRKQKPNIKLPPEYENEYVFLEEMRREFFHDFNADIMNRDASAEDLSFAVGNQWPEDQRANRERARKPTLTINRIPAFVDQVLGSRRLNETQIDVIPTSGGTKQVAEVRADLIRSIQRISKAGDAYDNALAGSVICGIGNFQIEVNYDNDDAFDQSIRIGKIADHLSVVWDRLMVEKTGADARRCYVVETYDKDEFEETWPWATPADMMLMTSAGYQYMSGWFENNDVRVVNYWRMRTKRRTIALMLDGTTQDITDTDDKEILSQIAQRPDGTPYIREVNRKFAQMYVCSATDVLDGPYDLPIDRVPVFRVPGHELRIGTRVYRWGLVRFIKDPQRLHNYWRSALAEKIMQSPRNVWIAADESVAGREQAWRDSHTSDDPLLIWNAESGQKPERVGPVQMEPALISQAEISSQDIKDVTNIHEANLGMPSNEVSGAAITARQRVSDTGTVLYHANLSDAIEEAGRVINQLIPIVYDTPRIIKVEGSDAQTRMVTINTMGNPNSIDITVGKYDVVSTTGPTYDTKRRESADNMLKLANAMPNILGMSADLIVEAQDWPGADKIAARIRNSLPPQILGPDEQTPEIQAKLQQQQSTQAAKNELAVRAATADMLQKQSQAALNAARAQNYTVEAQLRPAKVENETLSTASNAASKELHDHLETIKVATGG